MTVQQRARVRRSCAARRSGCCEQPPQAHRGPQRALRGEPRRGQRRLQLRRDRRPAALARSAGCCPTTCGAVADRRPREGRSASLRIRCRSVLSEKALLAREGVRARRPPQGRRACCCPRTGCITRVTGTTTPDASAPAAFPSPLSVPLVSGGRPVGTLSLFSAQRRRLHRPRTASCSTCWSTRPPTPSSHLRAAEHERPPAHRAHGRVDGRRRACSPTSKNEVVVLNPAARTHAASWATTPTTSPPRHLKERSGFSPFELVRGWEYGGQQDLARGGEAVRPPRPPAR